MTHNEKIAKTFKAFCDPNRLAILNILQYGEKCACEILERISIGQPTLSHHMRILCDAGIVSSRKLGKMTFYSMDNNGVDEAKQMLEAITEIIENEPSAYLNNTCSAC